MSFSPASLKGANVNKSLPTFPGKDPDENLVLVLRRHKFLLFRDVLLRLVLVSVVACLPILFSYADQLPACVAGTLHKVQASSWFWIAYGVVLPLLAIRVYAAYFNWKHDLYIITDRRVVDYNWYSPFRRRNTDAPLGRVQDSNYEKKGLFANLLNYGALYIETAAEKSPFAWNGLPGPDGAQRTLREAVINIKGSSSPADEIAGL